VVFGRPINYVGSLVCAPWRLAEGVGGGAGGFWGMSREIAHRVAMVGMFVAGMFGATIEIWRGIILSWENLEMIKGRAGGRNVPKPQLTNASLRADANASFGIREISKESL
jgi:hypothetical protein